jgi:nicotinate-nucleotide adenylyltransferase
MTGGRVGILGGTFDPIHCGHLDAGRAAESALGLTAMFVVTSNIPPHRPQPAASSHHRFAMVAMAVAGRNGWRASDMELAVGTPSFTTGTLRRFQESGWAATDLFFVIGADAFAEIETWKDYPAILDLANFAVVSRPGCSVDFIRAKFPALAHRMATPTTATGKSTLIFLIDAPTTDVSSTAIRQRCAAREPIDGLVPSAVQQHIAQHALYASISIDISDLSTTGGVHSPSAGRLHGQD